MLPRSAHADKARMVVGGILANIDFVGLFHAGSPGLEGHILIVTDQSLAAKKLKVFFQLCPGNTLIPGYLASPRTFSSIFNSLTTSWSQTATTMFMSFSITKTFDVGWS